MKKKTRNICVQGIDFRWLISPRPTQIVLTSELQHSPGQRIIVAIDSDIDRYWLEFPYVDDLNLKVLKPKEIAMIITQALESGWTPSVKGAPLRFQFKDGKLMQETPANTIDKQ